MKRRFAEFNKARRPKKATLRNLGNVPRLQPFRTLSMKHDSTSNGACMRVNYVDGNQNEFFTYINYSKDPEKVPKDYMLVKEVTEAVEMGEPPFFVAYLEENMPGSSFLDFDCGVDEIHKKNGKLEEHVFRILDEGGTVPMNTTGNDGGCSSSEGEKMVNVVEDILIDQKGKGDQGGQGDTNHDSTDQLTPSKMSRHATTRSATTRNTTPRNATTSNE